MQKLQTRWEKIKFLKAMQKGKVSLKQSIAAIVCIYNREQFNNGALPEIKTGINDIECDNIPVVIYLPDNNRGMLLKGESEKTIIHEN